MTTSDLERTLAEARAAAARRLQSLKRAEGQPQQAESAAEPAIAARREPAPSLGEPLRQASRIPPEQVMFIETPPVVDLRVAHVASSPEPPIAHPRPQGPGQVAARQTASGQSAGEQPARQPDQIEASYRPVPGPAYVPVDPISRTPERDAAPPLRHPDAGGYADAGGHVEPGGHAEPGAYVEPGAYAEPGEYLETASVDARREPPLTARLLAGVAAFRRSRAERRALAQAETIPAEPRKQALTAKERRWERRRKRYLFEEILGWILVPIILVAIYFFALWILELSGISPDTLIEGIRTIWSQFT